MDLLNEVADQLAKDVLAAVEQTGNDELITEVKKAVGSASATLEEAFQTAVRIRRAEAQGRRVLERMSRS